MLLPVQGRIRVGFGETDELGGRSKGVTFIVRSGATVVTPLAGKVKFAGPFQKYKQILIIEHRGGYHSLIAGLGRIDTVVGASLDAGEPVGSADNSSSESRVYYELRQNGEPVNPQKLLAEQHKQDRS
jgi:septal ring factor EnvC (AmiA/AmiB activator)